MSHIRVAAIQMSAKVGDVASNLSRAESLVREALNSLGRDYSATKFRPLLERVSP